MPAQNFETAMPMIVANIVFAASSAMLGGAGIAYTLDTSTDPRSDLSGATIKSSPVAT